MIQQTSSDGWWDIADKAYYADADRISCSMLKTFLEWRPDFRDFYLTQTRQREDSAAMMIGRAFHTKLLEPHRFIQLYHWPDEGMNVDRRTKEGKENWQRLQDDSRTLLTVDQWSLIEDMADACRRHEQVREILNLPGVREKSFRVGCPETSLQLKGRPDILLDNGIVVDVKTTSDVTRENWLNIARRLRYHMQAAFYLDCLSKFTKARTFVHVVVGTYEPFPVVVYRLGERAIERGRTMYKTALSDLADCFEFDDWSDPAEQGIIEVDFPEWYYRQEG